MIIIELPARHDGSGLRAGAIGSCRVSNPFYALAKLGELKICQASLQATHSMAEALQTFRYTAGELRIPDRLSPYIFDSPRSPSAKELLRTLRNGLDAYVVEVSDDRNFYYRDICLQQNFFSINLVRAHGGVLLGWFREVCANRPIDEALIQSALEQLKQGGHRHDDEVADLLRNIRYERQSEEEIALQLGAMMTQWGGRWIIVGPFDVPGYDGAIMQHRRDLNEKLSRAAKRCGALFYDPSALVREHGRSTALDGGGADIYEYAPAFFPVVGETQVRLLRASESGDRAPGADDAEDATEAAAGVSRLIRSQLVERVNAALLELHRGRLATLGVTVSGLGPHYQAAVGREVIVGPRELGTLELISSYLPSYDAYAVMRAGLGELALLLAASGRKAIAYEPNATRRAAIEAGRAHLEGAGLIAPGLLTIVPSLTPGGPLEGRVLGVGLDVAHVMTEADAAPHFARLAGFEAMLINLDAFLRRRSNQDELDFAAERLSALGFVARRDYWGDRLTWFRRDAVQASKVSQ
jgi:hypothetical protein